MSNRNLFSRIVKNENDVTELLVNLMQQKFFRDICLRWLLKDFVDPSKFEELLDTISSGDVESQYNTKENGIPDIVIENEQCFFIIENKIKNTTTETEKQRDKYPNIVQSRDKDYKGIIFLVPRDYQLVLNKEAYKKVNWHKLHWDDFLLYLSKQQVGEISNVYRDALDQMQKVIDNTIVFDTRLLPLEKAMITSTEIFPLLNAIEGWLPSIEPTNGELSTSQNGIGYYTDNYCKFIGMSPKVKNLDYFFAQSSFSDKESRDNYCEWSDSEDGYWIYIDPNENGKDCPIPNDPLDKYIYQQKILAIYTFADKIGELCLQFIHGLKGYKLVKTSDNLDVQKNHAGIGCYFDSESNSVSARYFIGYGPNVKDDKFTLYVSTEPDKRNLPKTDNEVISPYNNTIYNIRIGDESIDFYALDENEHTVWLLVPMDKICLCYDDLAQQQRAFNEEASKALEKAKKLNLNKDELNTATRVLFKNVENDTEDNTLSN